MNFMTFVKVRALAAFLVLVSLPALGQAITFTRTSSSVFYIDTSDSLRCGYVSISVTNETLIDIPDVWTRLGSFTSTDLGIAPTEDGISHIGPLAAGQSKMAFYYLCATNTAVSISGTINAYPSSLTFAASMGSQTFAWTVDEAGSANSNKVEAVFTGPVPPILGGVVTLTVSGTTGTINGGQVFAYTPASSWAWPATTFELFSTTIQLYGANASIIQDRLVVPPPLTTTSSTFYIATYLFKAVASTAAPTSASPVNYITNGVVKHTDIAAYGSVFEPISPPVNTLTLSLTPSAATVVLPNTLQYTIRVANTGAYSATLDSFKVALPSSPSLPGVVGGTSLFNGSPVPDPLTDTGNVMSWDGTYSIPAGSFRDFTFTVTYNGTPGTYTLSATAKVGATIIDTTLNTADNAPSAATVTVLAPTPTPTQSPVYSPTDTPSISPTFSDSPTQEPTSSVTPSVTPSISPTHTETATLVSTSSATPSVSPTSSDSASPTSSATFSASPTPTVCHPVIYAVSSRGSSPADDVVMIYNPCGACVDISGWKLRRLGSGACPGSPVDIYTFGATSMPSGSYQLLVTASWSPALWGGVDVADDNGLGAIASADSIELVDASVQRQDLVGLQGASCYLGSGTAPGTLAGHVVYRSPLPSTDSSDNAADFADSLIGSFSLSNGVGQNCFSPTASPTQVSTFSATPSISPTFTETATEVSTFSVTPSISPTFTETATEVSTFSATPSISPTFTEQSTGSPTESSTYSVTASISPTYTETATEVSTFSVTPSISPTFTETATEVSTFSVTPSISPTFTETATEVSTFSVTPSISPTFTETATEVSTFSATPSISPTFTETATEVSTFSVTPSISPTFTEQSTGSATETLVSTFSVTPSVTPSESPTFSASPTEVSTSSVTPSTSPTFTEISTSSVTPSVTSSESPTFSASPTEVSTFSVTPSISPTFTLQSTGSATETLVSTFSVTPSVTPSESPTFSASPTELSTSSVTPSTSPTFTEISTSSVTPSVTPSESPTFSASPTEVSTFSVTPSISPTFTELSTGSPTESSTYSVTPSISPTFTETATTVSTFSVTPSISPTFTETATTVSTSSATPSVTPTATATTAPPQLSGLGASSGLSTGGYSLTISGSGFQAGAIVWFGSVSGTVTVLSPGSITVTVPAHAAGAVNVTVENPDGQVSNALIFTFVDPTPTASPTEVSTATPSPTPNPAPVFISVSQSGQATGGGFVITVTGTGFLPGATIWIDGQPLLTTYVNGTILTAIAPPHAGGSANIQVSNTGPSFASGSGTITYQSLPTSLLLAPVPSKPGQPVCLYSDSTLAESRWTVFGVDQQLVARLYFDSGQHCFTETLGLAPGIYLVRIVTLDVQGRKSTAIRNLVIQP